MCYKYVMFGGTGPGGEFGFGVDGLVGECHGKNKMAFIRSLVDDGSLGSKVQAVTDLAIQAHKYACCSRVHAELVSALLALVKHSLTLVRRTKLHRVVVQTAVVALRTQLVDCRALTARLCLLARLTVERHERLDAVSSQQVGRCRSHDEWRLFC